MVVSQQKTEAQYQRLGYCPSAAGLVPPVTCRCRLSRDRFQSPAVVPGVSATDAKQQTIIDRYSDGGKVFLFEDRLKTDKSFERFMK